MLINYLRRKPYRQKILKKVNGFTLVELIVVIAIISVLAALSILASQHFVGKAKVAIAESTLTTVRFVLLNHVTASDKNVKFPITIDFTTGFDEQGNTVIQQPLLDQINRDLFPPSIIYVGNINGFSLTAAANDRNHTILILTETSLDLQGN